MENMTSNEFIFRCKLAKLKVALKDYYESIEQNTVSIPEFCKMKEDTIEWKVSRHLEQIVKSGEMDRLYNLAVQNSFIR